MSENGSDPQPQGTSEASSTSAPIPMPNHFSCVSCRRRKVKCNKLNPCNNCTKARLMCVFPTPRRQNKDSNPNPALVAKIHRLEGVINSLRLTVYEKDAQLAQEQQRKQQEDQGSSESDQAGVSAPAQQLEIAVSQPDSLSLPSRLNSTATSPQWTANWKGEKLVKDEGRNIYLSGTFWAVLTAHADDWGQLGDESFRDEDSTVSAPSTASVPFSAFPFDSSRGFQNREHPILEHRQKLWDVFKECIDPIIKLLHMPTIEPKVNEWLTTPNTEEFPANLNALFFAISFSAVSSMENDVCLGLLGTERDALVARYRAAEENALMTARLLHTDDVLVIQSFILYIVTLRHHDPRFAWTLYSLAFRLLQSLGAHRDGVSLSLSAFDAEIYKRLTWNLCSMECGAAGDSGCHPTIFEVIDFNTTLPINVDDKDLDVNMVTVPEARSHWTEMTILVLWGEICQLWRLVYDSRRHPDGMGKDLNSCTDEERKAFAIQCARRFEDKYVKICSPLIPIQWVTATLARLLILEFKLVSCKPLERHSELSQIDCDEFFTDAVECVDLSNRLNTDHRGVRWAWLFKAYTMWYPLAFVLTELGSHPLRNHHEKAWQVVEQAMVSRWRSSHYRLGYQWRSMLNLLEIAQAAKSREKRQRRESIRSRSDPPPAPAPAHAATQDLWLFRQAIPWKPTFHDHAGLTTAPEPLPLRPQHEDSESSAGAGQAGENSGENADYNHNMVSANELACDLTGDFDDVDVMGEFNFSSDAINIDSSETSLLQASYQLQDIFTMELG